LHGIPRNPPARIQGRGWPRRAGRSSEEGPLSQSEGASDKLAVVGILAAGLAHELNNPIGSILLAAQNAKVSPDRSEECLDTILRNARRCAEVVRSVLEVSRAEPADHQEFDVNGAMSRAVAVVMDEAAERHATVESRPDPAASLVLGSALQFEQAVTNLLRNAIESAESGVRVVVTSRLDRDGLCIDVSDDGRGMSEEVRQRAFEPFFTTRQNEGGTGLGLSLVRAIAHAHGGRVRITSTSGDGTRVEVRFPVCTGTRPSGEGVSTS